MKATRSHHDFFNRAAGWLFACGLGLVAAYSVFFPITDTDIWWHLAAGRAIAESHALLRSDIFSHLSYGMPWIDLHWGFQCLTYALWRWGGEAALVWGKASIAATLALLIWSPLWFRLAWRSPSPSPTPERLLWALPWAWLLTFSLRHLTDIRPLWITLALLTVQWLALQAFWLAPNRSRRRGLFGLAILGSCQILMVNLQGLFLLGPGLMACLLFGHAQHARPSRLGLPLFLAALSLINPYGPQAFALAFKVARRIVPNAGNVFSSDMAENMPLWTALRLQPESLQPLVLTLFAGTCFALALTWVRREKAPWGEALAYLACLILSALAIRNLPLALMTLSWWLVRTLETQPLQRFIVRNSVRHWALVAVLLVFLPIAGAQVRQMRAGMAYELPGAWVTPFRLPLGAADFLAAHAVPGPIFNELRHGGYLAWRFADPNRNFIDGRMVLRTAEQFREVMQAFDRPETFAVLQQRHGLTHVLLPLMEWDRYRPLGLHLLRNGAMRLVYCDGASALLVSEPLADSLAHTPDRPPADRRAFEPLTWDDASRQVRDQFASNPALMAMALRSAEAFWRHLH